jgi:ribosomal protein L31
MRFEIHGANKNGCLLTLNRSCKNIFYLNRHYTINKKLHKTVNTKHHPMITGTRKIINVGRNA